MHRCWPRHRTPLAINIHCLLVVVKTVLIEPLTLHQMRGCPCCQSCLLPLGDGTVEVLRIRSISSFFCPVSLEAIAPRSQRGGFDIPKHAIQLIPADAEEMLDGLAQTRDMARQAPWGDMNGTEITPGSGVGSRA